MRRHLTYANVTATLALFVALGGGAYAISKVGSKEIRNGAIRSADLRNRKAVAAEDVRRNALGGSEINEKTLNASRFASVAGRESGDCNPDSLVDFTDCVHTGISLSHPMRLLVVATGNEESVGGSASATCEVRIDDAVEPVPVAPGESPTDNTDSLATNGFARTFVASDPLPSGRHEVSLSCAELSGDVKIDAPTIAVIAINSP